MASSTQEEISADSKDASIGKAPKFLVGVAVSVYQNSGAEDNLFTITLVSSVTI